MANVRQIQSNFNAGELSPRLMGRTDLAKYFNGCSTLENFCILQQGGIYRRPGTRYVAKTKSLGKKTRLIPFEYSLSQAYVLELGNLYARIYKNGAPLLDTPNPVTNGTFDSGITGWTDYSMTAHGAAIAWNASRLALELDASYYTHFASFHTAPAIAGQSIATTAGHTYRLEYDLTGHDSSVSIGSTLHGADLANVAHSEGHNIVTFTATGSTTYIEIGTGSAFANVISYIDNVTTVDLAGIPVEITTPFLESDLAAIKYTQSADVLYIVHPTYPPKKLVRYGETDWTIADITFLPPPTSEHGLYPNTTLTPEATTGSGKKFTPGSDVFLHGDIGRTITYRGGVAVITSLTADSPPKAVCDIISPFSDTNPMASGKWHVIASPRVTIVPTGANTAGGYTTFNVTGDLTAAGAFPSFRAADVGSYIRGNGGLSIITTFNSSSSVQARIIVPAHTMDLIGGGAWSLELPDWNAAEGYPSSVCFYEQRLMFAGNNTKPTTIWGSVTGDYENFAYGSNDADSVVYTIVASLVDPIRWILPIRVLLVGTLGGEFRMQGGGGNPITPSTVDIKSETTFGSAGASPIRIGDTVLFVQRATQKLRNLIYAFESDSYKSADLALLADHILIGGITQLAYQQEPNSQVWGVRGDGQLLSVTYNEGEQVTGWSRHITQGIFESCATIPNATGTADQVWIVVNRTVGGNALHYVEMMDPTLSTDCATTYSFVTPQTVLTGLDYLEGMTVKVIADGEEVADAVVSGGSITLATAASVIEVGLEYTPTLVTVRPEVAAKGTAQGNLKRWAEAWIRTYNSRGLNINGDDVDDYGLVTADIRVNNLGYDRDGRITITQPHPYPATILSLFGTLSVGD